MYRIFISISCNSGLLPMMLITESFIIIIRKLAKP